MHVTASTAAVRPLRRNSLAWAASPLLLGLVVFPGEAARSTSSASPQSTHAGLHPIAGMEQGSTQTAWILVDGLPTPALTGLSRADQLERLRAPERLSKLEAIRQRLLGQGAQAVRVLWLGGRVAFRASGPVLERIAADPALSGWRRVADRPIFLPWRHRGAQTSRVALQPNATSWNVESLGAPMLWAEGVRGEGAVVASLDSGADAEHQALAAGFRGNTGDWLSLVDSSTTPVDDTGHGTASLALAVGRDVDGLTLGVAPGAQWIAARMFQNGVSSLSLAQAALQWALDPDGSASTDDAPEVVLLSWWLEGTAQVCAHELDLELDALLAAGISVVAAAGNTGPGSGTSVSPANHPGVLSVGAVDAAYTVASFSARGPSACGGLYPSLVAGGVDVVSADLSLGGILPTALTSVSGTSFAAPHLAGALALMLEASPSASPSTLQSALQETALDLGAAGAENDYGFGLPDVWSAAQLLPQNLPPIGTADTASVRRGKSISIPVLANDVDPEGLLLASSLRLESLPAQGTATVLEGGLIGYTAGRLARGSDVLTYSVADAGGQRTGMVTVSIQIQSR